MVGNRRNTLDVYRGMITMQTDVEYLMFSKIWKFYKEYRNVRDNDEYWEKVVSGIDGIYKEFPTELCKGMVLQILEELERRYKQGC